MFGLIVTVGLVPLDWPSLVISIKMRGLVVPAGNVYLCNAVRRVVVNSTWIDVDWKIILKMITEN